MALTQVVPRLRQQRICLETAAVYFWRGLEGAPCLDSCGIFVLNRPGEYILCWGPSAVHDNDETGLLWQPSSDLTPRRGGYNRHDENKGGPGHPYHCYYPKQDARAHLMDLLTASEESMELMRNK